MFASLPAETINLTNASLVSTPRLMMREETSVRERNSQHCVGR
jgi:hypothetical protein